MKNYLFFAFLFTLISHNINAQTFVLLKSGEKIEYKKYKIKSKDHLIEINKPKPFVVDLAEINYLVNKKGEIKYIKERNVEEVGQENILFASKYTEMEKVIEGKISIFKYVVNKSSTNPYGAGDHTVTYFYMEMGDKFDKIFNPNLLESGKKHNLKTFQEYFSDDAEILKTLNSNSFKANSTNILELIRKYNINAFQSVSPESESELYDVILFRGYTGQDKELTAEIDVAGKKITLANMNYKRIKLPERNPVKICISNGTNKMCDLISGSKCVLKNYEIQLKPNGDIYIEVKNKKEYQRYIHALNDSY